MATGLVASRSRAAARVDRISTNMDRSTGYLLSNLNATPNSRATRDSSIGAMGRSNYESVRYRDSSLTRGGRLSAADRHSVMIPSSYETAKFNREQQMKDIHSSFMKKYNETTNALNGRQDENEGERRSKAYQKIISNATPTYMNEEMAKKQTVSEMFMDTSKFSTKTLSAINGLEGAVLRKNKEYNWRKEMEDYEKRAEFERDVRARNVTALHRHDKDEDSTSITRKREAKTEAVKPIEKAAKKQQEVDQSTAVKSWRQRREEERAKEAEPEPERKSWREKLAEKHAQEEEEKKKKAEEAAAAAASAAATVKQVTAAAEAGSADATADATAEKPAEEEEDASGAKKLRSDFNTMMSGLDAEFEAGRSKLAKLRERIRRAKMAVKEADTALAEDDKARTKK